MVLGLIDSNVMPESFATWLSSRRIPDMSWESGIAFTSRNRFATRTGLSCLAAAAAAWSWVSRVWLSTISFESLPADEFFGWTSANQPSAAANRMPIATSAIFACGGTRCFAFTPRLRAGCWGPAGTGRRSGRRDYGDLCLDRVEVVVIVAHLRARREEHDGDERGHYHRPGDADEHGNVRLRALGLVAWEEVDGTHELVLDPEADGDGQRADLIGLAKALRHLHTDERVADPHLHADHPLELGGEAVQVR